MIKDKKLEAIAIAITLLFIGVSLTPATADIPENKHISAEYAFVNEDRTIQTKTVELTKDELKEFATDFLELTEELQSASDYESVENILDDFYQQGNNDTNDRIFLNKLPPE